MQMINHELPLAHHSFTYILYIKILSSTVNFNYSHSTNYLFRAFKCKSFQVFLQFSLLDVLLVNYISFLMSNFSISIINVQMKKKKRKTVKIDVLLYCDVNS